MTVLPIPRDVPGTSTAGVIGRPFPRPAVAVLLVLSMGLLPATAGADRRAAAYKVKYRVAEELLPVAEAALAGTGSVALDRGTNSLVLIGDPGAVTQALELLATQDRRLRTVVLRYDTTHVRDLEALGFDVDWTAEAGDFRIGNLRRPRRPGSGSSVDVRVDEAARRLADSFTGTIRATEGSRTQIATGTSVPYTTVGRHGPNTRYVTATTGFEADPRILGDGRVQVDLAAFAGRLGRGATVERTHASTLVVLTPGETMAVAGIDRSRRVEEASALSGVGSESHHDEALLLLRADIE